MTDAATRAREILDAIEREAGEHRDTLAKERRALPSVTGVARQAQPPAPADLVPGPRELDALLAGVVTAPEPRPATTAPSSGDPAAGATVPPTAEAARLLALVDRVVEQTKHVQERVEVLDAAVRDLSARLGVEETVLVGGTATAEPPAAIAALPAGTRTDGARLVGIEMAVAGHSRGEVELHLVREFGLADPRSVLDRIFGSGSTGDSRMPWGGAPPG